MTTPTPASSTTTTTATRAPRPGPLDVTFTETLLLSPAAGGWTYLVWPGSADFFGTRGRVRVRGSIDGVAFSTSFLALGDGRHKLPVAPTLRREAGKEAGDTVTVHPEERIA